MTKSTVHTILNLFKQAKIDQDGYSYPNGLLKVQMQVMVLSKRVSLFDSEIKAYQAGKATLHDVHKRSLSGHCT